MVSPSVRGGLSGGRHRCRDPGVELVEFLVVEDPHPVVLDEGDPARGLVHVIDATTIAVAERPGNRRADGYRNILTNPHVGLLLVIPGRGDTLRINGRGRLVCQSPFFDAMVVDNHRPVLALVVEIEQIFHHCAKALMRSRLWQPDSRQPDTLPSRAELAKALDRTDEDLTALRRYYDPSSYATRLYTS